MKTQQRLDMCCTERRELTSGDSLRTAAISSQSLPELDLNLHDRQASGDFGHCSRSLFRRSSQPASNLPLLNLSALREHVPTGEEICTPRRNVERIGRSLSRVKPYLYVGSKLSVRDASTIEMNGISHMINLGGHLYHNQHSGVKYLSLSIRDDVGENIEDFFDVCIAFINEARQRGGACAVVCTQGISRSGAIVVAYLMSMENMSMDEALRRVRKSRPIIAPNSAFLNQLSALERRLTSGRRSAWMGKLTYVGSVDKVLIGRNVSHTRVDSIEDEVFIIEKSDFEGVVVWKGRHAPEHMWKEAVRVAHRMDARVRAECELRSLRLPNGGVQLCAGGDDAAAMERLLRATLRLRA